MAVLGAVVWMKRMWACFLWNPLPVDSLTMLRFGFWFSYVSHISNDFHSTKRQELEPTDKGAHIALLFVEHNTEGKEREMLLLDVISSATIKAVFSSYAEKRGGVSLRSFRFSFKDKNLFLSQIAKRTLADLGWKDQDVITVHALGSPQQSNISNSGQNGPTVSSPGKAKKQGKKLRRGSSTSKPVKEDNIKKIEKTLEEWKIEVSWWMFVFILPNMLA